MTLDLHPDRLFPPDPTVRDIARELYASVADLPIISPHGHVPPQWIADDVPFRDPTSLLITPDHYITRLLHASGVDLADLGVGTELDAEGARRAFRLLCEHWPVFRGTPMRYWLESQLVEVFGVYLQPSPTSAETIYDRISTWIEQPTSRPRALMEDFGNEMARMATEDGLTMTLHPAVHRNHHGPTFERFGADVGADIPIGVEVTQALAPLLGRYGTHPNLTLVVFTIDETVYSRELAPLAAFYPSVRIGVPWWFIDAPDAIRRFRAAVTETAGFTRTSGFIDDTRAFLSIPARHDMSRRLDCAHLAELVAEHRLGIDEAAETARYLVVDQPRDAFGI